jgi:ferritin-like metal-binding protein YciE
MQTLHELFLHGLNDILDAEHQLVIALQGLASDSSQEDLKKAFESHRIETEGHVRRLHQCFELLGERPRNTECRGIRTLIVETKAFRREGPAEGVINAFNVGVGIKSETYEIREYESLIDMAAEMKLTDVAKLLTENLREERTALKKLVGFSQVNC